MFLNLIKIFVPTTLAFFVGIAITPIATHFFYKYKMWKKYSRNEYAGAEDFKRIHNEGDELRTPRVGGIIIWASVLITTLLILLFSVFFPSPVSAKINFLSRNQTLIPFFTLLLGAIVGLWDDLIQCFGKGSVAHDDKSWRLWKILIIISSNIMILAIASTIAQTKIYQINNNSIIL